MSDEALQEASEIVDQETSEEVTESTVEEVASVESSEGETQSEPTL